MPAQVDLETHDRDGGRLRIDGFHSFDAPQREIAVAGWSCLPDRTVADELWLECNGARFPCLSGLARFDVARHYETPALNYAGFVGRVPTIRSLTTVTLAGSRNGTRHVLGEFKITHRDAGNSSHGVSRGYAQWLRQHEAKLFWPTTEVDARRHRLPFTPLISIVLPTYNTRLYHLHRCIDSVVAQRYPHWELCIADDASPNPRVRAYLAERAASEPRIRLTFCPRNAGISAASNAAIATATGEFLVLLDHDDELHPFALLEVVRCLNAHSTTDLVYSDEDKIDQLGIRSEPAFKADFDEDQLHGFNYFGHLVALRAALVREVGGFRSKTDGAQDWDLLLRVVSVSGPDRIQHIAKPLYHWRKHEESTAQNLDAKPYALRAWNVVLSHYVGADDRIAVREGLFLGSMRLERQVPADTRLSIVYRACDGEHQRRALKRSRAPGTTHFFELVFAGVYPVHPPDASAILTIEDLQSDVTIVVNCRIDSINHHFIEELAAQALREDCGVIAATIVGADGRIVSAGLAYLSDGTYLNPYQGMALTNPGYMGQAKVVRQVSSVSPHVFAVQTKRLHGAGGLARLTEDSLSQVCDSLIDSAHIAGLKVLHTPYAIATLRRSGETFFPRHGGVAPERLALNRNLEAFPDVGAILREGLY